MPRSIPLIRAGVLAPTLAFLRRVGAPVERLVGGAKLRPDVLEDPEAWIPLLFGNRLVESASFQTGIPDLGLLASREVDPFGLGTYGRLMAGSGTLGQALETSQRLKPAFNSGAQVRLTRVGSEIHLRHRFLAGGGDSWNQSVAITLVLHVNLLHEASGGRWRPRHIDLPIPASRAFHECPVLADARIDFGAPATTIRFPASLLAVPLQRRIAATPIVRRPFEAPPRQFAASVRTLVSSLLDTGYPSVALVADAAGMNVRTFQRRLYEKGLTYAQIVSDVRLAEGSRRLVESNQPIVEIALQLGYSDHAHFTRAFRAWTGSSPREFRRAYRVRESRLAQPATPPPVPPT